MNKHLFALSLCILFPVVVFLTLFWRPSSNVVEKLATGIVASCAHATDKSACYEKEVPELYPKYTVPQLFDVVRRIRALDPKYQFCHVLSHKIGQQVVALDPNHWIDAIPLNPPDGLCSNGYIHGVTGGRFRSEVLDDATIQKFLPDFTNACAPRATWNPSGEDRAICYHGMGHLFDFITNADIKKSLDLCAQTTPHDYSKVCIEGVFMQIYQPLEPDDFQLIAQMKVKPATSTVRTYCASFKDPRFVGACLRESWPFFDVGIRNGTAVNAFCSKQPEGETENCFQSISAIIGRMSLSNPQKAVDACGHIEQKHQGACFSDSAFAVLEENRNDSQKAIALCKMASSSSLTETCLGYLTQHAYFLFGNNRVQYQNFCNALPADLRSDCVTKGLNAEKKSTNQ